MSKTIVDLKDVSIFQKKKLVLRDINITIEKGDFVYLIGKTGSGKSSLLKVLYGDLTLQKGSGRVVELDPSSLRESEISYLRRKIGIVSQDFKLLPDRTVFENLEFVLKATGWEDKKQIQERIDRVLTKVQVQTKSFKYPHQLSGGEQQRVAIARALLNDPELILADEPTGNLDPETSVEIMKVLREINDSGRSILMATHDYALILKFPAKTIKCDMGRLFEVVQRTT